MTIPGPRPLRVVFVLPAYPWHPVGGFRVAYEYANRLVDRGHTVTVVHARACPVRRGQRAPAPFSARRTAGRLKGWLRSRCTRPALDWHDIDPRVHVLYVPTLAARHVPAADVVVATSWRTAPFVAGYGAEHGRKFYLIQSHEVWDGTPEAVEATWKLPMRKVVIARWLERTGVGLGVDADEIRLIPNAIDQDRYRVLQPIATRPKRVAALCHEAESKGARDAVAALQIARTRVPELEAVMFGVSGRPPWVPAWIDYRHDPDQAELVADVYNGSSLYLCASRLEGWHLPPAEAMACGCAVVSTDIDGVADYAIDGQTALLAEPSDPEGLGRRMVELLLDDQRRVELANQGRDFIRRFSWSESTDALEGWFLEAVQDAARA